jgi:hypothetical protein
LTQQHAAPNPLGYSRTFVLPAGCNATSPGKTTTDTPRRPPDSRIATSSAHDICWEPQNCAQQWPQSLSTRSGCVPENTTADFGRCNPGRNRKYGNPRAITIGQTINKILIAQPAATIALRACSKRASFLVPDMNPFDLAWTTKLVGQTVQTIADDAINPLNSREGEGFR